MAGKTIHLDLTTSVVQDIAIKEFSYDGETAKKMAEAIAAANMAVDSNQYTGYRVQPQRHFNRNKQGESSQELYAKLEFERAIKDNDLKALGRALHSLQDKYTHGEKHWFGYGRHIFGPHRIRLKGHTFCLSPYDPDTAAKPGTRLYRVLWEQTAEYVREYMRAECRGP